MTTIPTTDLEALRRRADALEAANAHLRRKAGDALIEYAALRRRVEDLRGRLPAADVGPTLDGGRYLTVHQVASRLGLTGEEAAGLLEGVATRTDAHGQTVIREDRFEQLVLDRAAGRTARRFL
ncbi:MAG: hypothetical protein GX591_16615 [Planctomycetes bacterium]|nr:hypothetical protein [Planctomycetota bacterium]